MRKLPIGLIFAAVLLAGCDHHKSASQAQSEANGAAVTQNDSDLTGQSSSDKPAPPDKPAPSSSENESTKPEAPSTATDTSTAPPSEPASSPAMTAPGALAESTPAPAPAAEKEIAPQVVVVLQTSFGRIVIALDDSAAPKTCENFRKLVSDGFYDHTTFHRVIANFVIQGGDPNSKSNDRSNDGQGGPGYTLPAEIKLAHDRGAVAMARSPDSVNPQRESNGSQFYICVAPCPSLDDQYTVFGHVIKGMDVATKIAEQPHDKRDDPLDRIEMEASLEPKAKALEEASTVNP